MRVRVGIDHDRNGWIDWGAGSPPNLISDALWTKPLTGFNLNARQRREITPYGLLVHEVELGADSADFYLNIEHAAPVVVGETYTLVLYGKSSSGGVVYTPTILDQHGGTVGGSYPSVVINTDWTKVAVTYTCETGVESVRLRLGKTAGTNSDTLEVVGYGVYAGRNAPVFTSDANPTPAEEITDYVLGLETSLGFSNELIRMIPEEGTATITLDNTEQTFTPNNPNSPYNKIKKYMLVCIEIDKDDSGNWQALWTGFVDSIALDAGEAGSRQAIIKAVQGIFVWEDRRAVYEPNYNRSADQILVEILERADLPADRYKARLDTGKWGINTHIFSSEGVIDAHGGYHNYLVAGAGWDGKPSLRECINDLIVNEQGYGFINRAGQFVFRNRNEVTATAERRASAVAFDVGEDVQAATYEYKGVQATSVSVTYNPKELIKGVLWQTKSENPIKLKKRRRAVIEVVPETSEGFPITALDIDPFSKTEEYSSFTAVTEQNKVRNSLVVHRLIQRGQQVRLIFKNVSSTLDLSIDVKLTGTGYYTKETQTIETESEAALAANYGRQIPVEVELKLVGDEGEAEAIADHLLNILTSVVEGFYHLSFIFGRDKTDQSRLNKVIGSGVGDVVLLTESQTGITDAPHMIAAERYSFVSGELSVDWTLIPVPSEERWILDQSKYGIDTRLGY